MILHKLNPNLLNLLRRIVYSSILGKIVCFPTLLLPLRRNRVFILCRNGEHFNCNPLAIANHLMSSDKNEWELIVGLRKGINTDDIPDGIRFVNVGTLRYYYYLYTSRFFLTNELYKRDAYMHKRPGQVFIHTMHGGHGIKTVAFDKVGGSDDPYKWHYLNRIADLVLSNSEFMTKYILRSGYGMKDVSVLEAGLPRNDVFYTVDKHEEIKKKVYHDLGISFDVHLAIYAPSYRYSGIYKDIYLQDYKSVVDALSEKFGGKWLLGISCHPYIRPIYKTLYDFTDPHIIDVAEYEYVQNLLIASDSMISDISSISMDMSLMRKPVFLLIKDIDIQRDYTYIDPEQLPFPYADNEETLCDNIKTFDNSSYLHLLEDYNRDVVKLKDNGTACEQLETWMLSRKDC